MIHCERAKAASRSPTVPAQQKPYGSEVGVRHALGKATADPITNDAKEDKRSRHVATVSPPGDRRG